ncbi:biotin transporter BioY [Petroclostridium sp. X23]|uniref:biotin transporter BioY n=1 Tax=Petroclostridium sp. X23 TaxID=3045146 RepID=UPI0024AE0CE6|nr:biotin transporter BioY [Petroclostridium sp. X23]WHH56909.1 biotin transporter BioY [Petroclostridium sp. X23]
MNLKTRDMILVALFAALMAVGAMVKIFFPVIPFTFQPFFCAFAGILLGARLGLMSQIVYITIGLAGIPVFTEGGGLMYVLKPSFGYLLGFAAGAYVIGIISERLKVMNLKNALISVMSGLAVIYLIGVPYIYLIVKFYMNKASMNIMGALSAGFFPFILKDLIMFVIVAVVAAQIVPILRRARLIPVAEQKS